jgi:hypothetical protein
VRENATNLILMLVALAALAALATAAFAPSGIAPLRGEELARRDDSSDVYGVSDDDDDGPGNPPTNDTGSDVNTNGKGVTALSAIGPTSCELGLDVAHHVNASA